MPIPIVNSIASWFLKKRIHQMELFFTFKLFRGLSIQSKSGYFIHE